jgi:catechol 2,3-dioxygenase-like lactoylglutathione lyase family enzyme
MIRRLAVALAVVLGLVPGAEAQGLVRAVGPIGMTVGDMERSVAFYSRVLDFEKVFDVEIWGPDWERLQGVFGLRLRVVRMRLGQETLELIEYLTPRGRPVPADSEPRPLVPARGDHRERHGPRLRAAARPPRRARLARAPALATTGT